MFVDNFTGWQQVTIPFADFDRSMIQPTNAPDDGLTLTEMWGYGFEFQAGDSGMFYLDDVKLSSFNKLYLPLVTREF